MAFTPDLPFPKSAGDPLKSKDWNDLVVETKRLDTAKVERAGDAITGSLSVSGTLAVGKTVATSTAKLDVAGTLALNDNNLMLRAGNDTFHGLGWFGTGKLFASTNPDGPVLWGNAGGALGTQAGGTQKVALSWNSSGNVAIGVASTELKVDIGDRIRLRQGASGSAGLWLYQTTPAADRAFIGMAGDTTVGLYGTTAGWSLTTDTNTGTVGVRSLPQTYAACYVNATSIGYGLEVIGATSYAVYAGGRIFDTSIRSIVRATNSTNTTSTGYVDVPNMQTSVTVPANIYRWFQIHVFINGVQTQGPANVAGYFRLLVDGSVYDVTRHEFNNNGWELRGVTLATMVYLGAGNHTISVQWATTAGTLYCCWYGDSRQIQIVEL
ncbi:hypothetical protein LRH25_31480 [Ideonella azotifigens]|uniref:Uncharacterized protein n=1 Tax=Ideonella azotifigens TaxID=513160 RepID=A0ABN1K036_9BURK|nr:hypothetical protein [Ideonella azotifigens]MCD2344847.1 hypothetical protein [Ideonella azotifigens]